MTPVLHLGPDEQVAHELPKRRLVVGTLKGLRNDTTGIVKLHECENCQYKGEKCEIAMCVRGGNSSALKKKSTGWWCRLRDRNLSCLSDPGSEFDAFTGVNSLRSFQ
jgi:hypothetical protein